MDDETQSRAQTCDETRPTRLHYQLRCLLPTDHDGEHRWTPELLTVDPTSTTAIG